MRVRDAIFMTFAILATYIASLLSKREAKFDMRINTSHRIEVLVMTETCGFSSAVADYLISWINVEAEALESYWTACDVQKATTRNALDRLERSKIRIQKFRGSFHSSVSESDFE